MRLLILITAFTLLLTSCVQYSLVEPAKKVTINGITLTPSQAWTQLPPLPALGERGKIWTANGTLLDQLIIVKVDEGQSLFKSFNKELPMPVFKANMLANDVESFVLTSLKNIYGGSIKIDSSNLRPEPLGNATGFAFELSFFNQDGLFNRAKVTTAIKDKQMYAVLYIAASVHYYDASLGEVNQLVASAVVQ